MIPASFFQISDRSNWDKTNIMLGKWRIVVAFLLGLSYFTFYSRGAEWIVYWMGWLIYAALWLPLQGRHTGEKPNLWTYLLDTDWVIYYLRDKDAFVRAIDAYRTEGIAISTISIVELYEGVYRSPRPEEKEIIISE